MLYTVMPCKLWTGSKRNGYGRRWHHGRPVDVHRIAWEATYGPVPDALCVLHRCDIRACHEPTHLFLGTRRDNSDDMIAKGRASHPGPGEAHPMAKLSNSMVDEIRSAYAAGNRTQRELATEFRCSQSNINRIIKRKGWV